MRRLSEFPDLFGFHGCAATVMGLAKCEISSSGVVMTVTQLSIIGAVGILPIQDSKTCRKDLS